MRYADQPRYSPNGKFFWDGQRWTPVEDQLWDVRLPTAVETAEPATRCTQCGAAPARRPLGDLAVTWLVALVLSLSIVVGGLVTYLVAAP